LDLFIAESRESYRQDFVLYFSMSVDNGGYFLSDQMKAWTFDRTRSDSALTLDHLTYHEFFHHLQFKYFLGKKGQVTDESVEDRMRRKENQSSSMPHWWTEGSAEFAGSFKYENGKESLDRYENLKVAFIENSEMPYLVGQKRMTLSQIFKSENDDDFSEYQPAGVFIQFLYEKEREIFVNLTKRVMTGESEIEVLFEGVNMTELDHKFEAYCKELVGEFRARQN